MTEVMISDPENPPVAGECPNCSTELSGLFCPNCGQRQVDLDRPLRELGAEAMEAFFSFDARILRTLWPLISRPGFLTVEFMAGRRKRYVHPFKLYFAISVALFIGLAVSGYSVIVIGDSGETVVAIGEGKGADLSVEAGDDVTPKMEPLSDEAPSGSAEFTVAESEDDDSFLSRMFQPLLELAAKDPERLDRIFSDRLANSIVILVPVFAALLRLLYRRRSYVAELVFSLHLHSFAFLALLAGVSVDLVIGASERSDPGNTVAVVAIAIYTFLALRRVQGQGRLRTIAKMIVLLVGYLVALIVTMILTLAVTALTV